MSALPVGGGFTFSLGSVGGTWRWTVSSSNLQGPGQLYQVQDILTPYGPMNVAMIPLPSDVVQSMAQSIIDVQNQVKARLVLVSSQTSFSTSVTEGDPRKNVGVVQIRNDGGFGSFLSVVATPSVPWLSVLTPEINGIARGDIATFNIDLVPDILVAAQSPYSGTVRIQDAADPSSYIIATVSVVVIPRPAIGVSTQDVIFEWSVLTQTPSTQYVVITNGGPGTSSLDFSIRKTTNVQWLSVSPESGGPLAAGSNCTITFSIVSQHVPLGLGSYTEIVSVYSSNASNSPVDIEVTLSVV